jgi:predicted Zn-dependent peptidase
MSLRFPVGAALEPATARGVAHLAEHIAFLQPSGEPNQTIAQMHAGHAAYSNASTSLDATQYISRFAQSELSAMVTAEALRWSPGQCLQVREVDFIKERDIVINELSQRADDADVNEAIMAAIWPAQHPYLRRIGGTSLQVDALTLTAVCAFIAENITVGNASLIFSGPVTESQIRSALAPWSKLASQKPNGNNVHKAFGIPDIQTETKVPRQVSASVETNTIIAAWPLPTDPIKLAQAQMIAHLLAVHVESLSDEVDAEVSLRVVGGEHGRFAVIVIAAAAPHQSLFDLITTAIETRDDWISTGGFAVTRQGELTRWQQSIEDIDNKIEMTHRASISDSSPAVAYYQSIAAISTLNVNDARDLLATTFATDKSHRLMMSPMKNPGGRASVNLTSKIDVHDQRLTAGQAASNAESPATAPRVDVSVQERTLTNGLHVIMVPDSSASVVRMTLSFAVHAGSDDESHQALRWLAADERLPRASEESRRMFTSGARVTARISDDAVQFSIVGLPAFADLHLDGLAQWLRYGGYSERSIDKRLQQLQAMRTPHRLGRQVATHTLLSAVYGGNHPYRFGQRSYYFDLDRVSEGDVRRFAEKHFTGGNATLLLTGNFDVAKISQWIDYSLSDLAGNFRSPPLPPGATRGARLALANNESGIEASIAFACDTNRASATSYARQLIMAEMLSEVAATARTQLAASYGVQAEFVPAHAGGMFLISGKLDSTRAAAAFDLIFKKVQSLTDGSDASKMIFANARRNVIGTWLIHISNSPQLHQLLLTAIELGQSPDMIKRLPSTAASVVYGDLTSQFASIFDPAKRVILLTGNRDAVAEVYRQLGFTPQWIALP